MVDKTLAENFSEKYLTISQYALWLGVSRQAVHRSIKEGRLTATRIGYLWFIEKGQDAE